MQIYSFHTISVKLWKRINYMYTNTASLNVFKRKKKQKNFYIHKKTLINFNHLRHKKYNISQLNYKIPTKYDPQMFILFLKRQFGLFKTNQYIAKRNKEQTLTILNHINKLGKYNKHKTTKAYKKTKILFSKKFNKLYYRAGRKILTKFFISKKYITQKYITKKIHNNLAKNWLFACMDYNMSHVLIKNTLFYSINDAKKFIKQFGCYNNDILIYDPKFPVNNSVIFSIIISKHILKFIRRKKKHIIKFFRRIKFYKYRVWHKKFGKIDKWFEFKDLINMYTVFFRSKSMNVEFDWRILTGICLKTPLNFDYINKFDRINMACYMARSYNWKYLT